MATEQAHAKLLSEVLQHPPLKHAETDDRSAPAIEPGLHLEPFPKEQLLTEISKGVSLRHVEGSECHDCSSPKIEAGVKVQPSKRGELLQEIRAAGGHHAVVSELKQTFLEEAKEGGLPLHHVETKDKSQPATQGANVGKWDKGAFLQEVQEPHWLNTVPKDQVHDASAPRVEDVSCGRVASPHKQLMAEVAHGAQLHHVSGEGQVHDASSPAVTKTAAMRVTPH